MALRVDLHFPDATHLDGMLEIHRVDFTDVLSELFQLALVAFSPNSDLEPTQLIGQTVQVHFPDQTLLPSVTGIVRQARRHTAVGGGTTEYRLSVVPREWLLTRARNTCIYQQQSGPDMAVSVLRRHGAQMAAPSNLPAARVREYAVQYGETDYDFVLRVLAEDGVTTLFDHRAGGAWLFTDDTAGGSVQFNDVITFNPSNLTPTGLAVLRWAEVADLETSAIRRRDYDFQKPGFTLQALESASNGGPVEASLEDYTYATGAFSVDAEGKDLTHTRLSAARASRHRLRLVTNFAAGAGSRFTVAGSDIAGDWVVVRSHSMMESSTPGQASLVHELIVIAADIPFRPRVWPKPRIMGVQTAFVVGDTPAGTVDTDEFGRVKVEFRWDRRDLGKGNPTRRVRVAQAWAGPGYGLVTLPRVGDEVLVAFSEGDPDLPLVMGRVHNAVSTTPLSLPEEQKTVSVWKSQSFGPSGPVEGYNFIFMDDAAGEELLAFRAQKNLSGLVLKDVHLHVKGHVDSNVVGNVGGKIEGNQTLNVKGNMDINVDGDVTATLGSLDLTAKAHMFLRTNDLRVDESVNHVVKAGAVYLQGKDVVQVTGAKFHVFCDEIVLQAGGSVIKITKGGIDIHSSGPVDVKGTPIKLNC
ncbi:MAG: type VI secretion system tip protein VgrG [Polyangiaceae bacterium]|nr:type VI secretion system tip protein VgrG [Polyangiaceae bacterium]